MEDKLCIHSIVLGVSVLVIALHTVSHTPKNRCKLSCNSLTGETHRQ